MNEKSLAFEDSEYLGDRELSLEPRSRFSGRREGQEKKQAKARDLATYASGRTARTKWRTRAVAATARLSRTIAPRSPSRARFSRVGKAALFYARRRFTV